MDETPSEPVTQLRRVPIRECGEELVDFLQACPALLLDRPRFRYRRETMLRRTVATWLCGANAGLPEGIAFEAFTVQMKSLAAVHRDVAADHQELQ